MSIRAKLFLAALGLSFVFALPAILQAQPIPDGKSNDQKLDPEKPSIYITFEKFGTRPPLRDDEKGNGVFLRLHNNLRTSIRFCAFGISNGERMAFYSDHYESGLNYEVEREPDNDELGKSDVIKTKRSSVRDLPVGYPTVGLCHSYDLAAGRSLAFSVPSEHLSEGLLIKIPFNYQWEKASEEKPLHFVRFSSLNLPRPKA